MALLRLRDLFRDVCIPLRHRDQAWFCNSETTRNSTRIIGPLACFGGILSPSFGHEQ